MANGACVKADLNKYELTTSCPIYPNIQATSEKYCTSLWINLSIKIPGRNRMKTNPGGSPDTLYRVKGLITFLPQCSLA